MKNSKIFQLFASLSKQEIARFEKFLRWQAPRQAIMLTLLSYLKKHKTAIENETITKETIYQKITGKKIYNDKEHRDICAKFSTLLCNFLTFQALKSKPELQDQLLLEELEKRKLDNQFAIAARKITRQSEKVLHKTLDDFHQCGLTYDRLFFHPMTDKYDRSEQSLTKAISHLDHYYGIKRLNYLLELEIRQILLGIEAYDSSLRDQIMAIFAAEYFQETPLIQIYTRCLLLLKQPDIEGFQLLKTAVYRLLPSLLHEERYRTFTLLMNICAVLGFKGLLNQTEEIYRLYQDGEREGILINKGEIDDAHFINAVFLACQNKEVDWGTNFLANKQVFLAPSYQKSVVALCKGLLLFEQGKFEETVGQLSLCRNLNLSVALQKYALAVKANFELFRKFRYHSLDDALDNFLNYLQSNKQIGEQLKLANLNFIKMIRQLKRESKKKADPNSSKIKETATSMTQLIEKQWIEAKITQLSPK